MIIALSESYPQIPLRKIIGDKFKELVIHLFNQQALFSQNSLLMLRKLPNYWICHQRFVNQKNLNKSSQAINYRQEWNPTRLAMVAINLAIGQGNWEMVERLIWVKFSISVVSVGLCSSRVQDRRLILERQMV